MSGTISLIDDFADEPLMVIVSEDEKALLCLHALEDMGLWLLRIDTTKAFEGFPAGFDHWDELVEASPWQVEMGSSYDWRWMYMKLKDMPENEFKKTAIPWSDFGHPQVYVKQEKIVPRLKGYAEPLIFQ
jgi:hypothetical protein